MTLYSQLHKHIRVTSPLTINAWSDLAGVIALIAAAGIGYFEYGLYSWKFVWSLVLIGMYFFVSWGVRIDDHIWLQNLKVAFLTTIPIIIIFFNINAWAAILMLFVLSARAMYTVPSRNGYYWICVFGAIVCIAYLTVWSDSGSILIALGAFAGYLFVGSAAEAQIKAVQASDETQRLLIELQNAHLELKARTDQAEELAATNERNHLAREVHDTLGHQLTVAAVQLEGAQKLIQSDPEKATAMVATVRGQVLDGLQELRRTVAALRAPIEEDLSLPMALERLTQDFARATDIDIDLDVSQDLPALPGSHRQVIFRVVQEAMTNIQKHAQAKNAHVKLAIRVDDDGSKNLHLSIQDDGVGLSTNDDAGENTLRRGFGLRGMTERVNQLNGTIALNNRASGGSELLVSLPTVSSAKVIANEATVKLATPREDRR